MIINFAHLEKHKIKKGDLMGGPIFSKIYDVVKKIPKGKVATYGQVALAAGNPHWSQVVGYALHANPNPAVIKCHRVVNRQGKISTSFVFGRAFAQKDLLQSEGVEVSDDGFVDLCIYGVTTDELIS